VVEDDDELPGLPVAGAAGPAGYFENVVQDRLWKGVRSKLAYRTQATQEGDPCGGSISIKRIFHRRTFCRGAGSRKSSSI
jgi:hypothetical protein